MLARLAGGVNRSVHHRGHGVSVRFCDLSGGIGA
jgi:hypothetical protein